LTDGVNSDTEVYLLATAAGKKMAGNIAVSRDLLKPTFGIVEKQVLRDGRISYSRFRTELLADGSVLLVGRDMRDQKDLEQLVGNALMAAAVVSVLLAIIGAIVFRDQLESRVGAIRRTAAQIEAGDLTQRIPVSGKDDEFARLSHDINLMLDRIEILMDGVRHVSNTIAHNLRTPLSRIRAKLEVARRPGHGSGAGGPGHGFRHSRNRGTHHRLRQAAADRRGGVGRAAPGFPIGIPE